MEAELKRVKQSLSINGPVATQMNYLKKMGDNVDGLPKKGLNSVLGGDGIPFYFANDKMSVYSPKTKKVTVFNVIPKNPNIAKSMAKGALAGAITIGTVVVLHHNSGKMIHLGEIAMTKSGEVVSNFNRTLMAARFKPGPHF